MKIFIIAQIMNGKEAVGYRLLDLDSNNQVKDYTIPVIKSVLENLQTSNIIRNAQLVNGVITGTNGQLSRYAKVAPNGMLLGDSPLVVINKIDDIGYTVVDFKGQVKKMKTSDVVEYAKNQGIANGKVVVQDNVEYISSISDSYEQISIAPSKVGARGKVDLRIHIDSDAKSIAKHTESDLESELQYNDVFSAMTPEQRAVLKQYYTWYTVDVYKGLAKNVRLNLAPGKAEKLAQLRGIDKWQFAGINDSHLECRFTAKCELGHNLRYEYFAIPEDIANDISVRTREWNNYSGFKTAQGSQAELKESGAIVFGETCAGDFFNIAPEDMKKLVKTRKIMSDEIELMADIITNHLEDMYKNKCKFLYDCILAMGSGTEVVNVFGKQIGYTLLSFAKANLPYPKSLVILAGNQIRKNKEVFYNSIVKGCSNTIHNLLNLSVKNNALSLIKDTLDYITDYTIEGEYQYDPINDKDCSRRDIGAYNKDTRNQRSYELRKIFNGTALSECELPSIDNINSLIKMVAKAIEINRYFDNYINNSDILKLEYNFGGNTGAPKSIATLAYDITRFASLNDKVSDEQLPYVNVFNCCLALNTNIDSRKNFNTCIITYVYGHRSSRYFTSFSKFKETFEEYGMKPTFDELFNNSIVLYENSLKAQKEALIEEKLNRPIKVLIELKDDTESKNIAGEKPCVKNVERKERELLESQVKGEYTGDDTITVYGGFDINVSDVKSFEEVNTYKFIELTRNVDRVVYEETVAKRKQKEEEERLAREKEAEEAKRLAEETRRREFDSDETMNKLKELLASHPEDDADYGVNVARNILERGIPFKDLSSKQQWRVTETIKQLGGNVEETNKQSEDVAPAKKKLSEYPEVNVKVDKLLEVLKGKDKDAIQKVNSASRLAFDIARTMAYKGEFSDKQLKHIEKAYSVLDN